MDTNRIRYFLSLAKTGSITKASELHSISPPAFSKAIKVFESEVGQTLTLPHGRGIILTDSATKLVPVLEEIIRKIDSVKDGIISDIEKSQQTLRLGTFEVFSTHFMAQAIFSAFRDHNCAVLEMIPGEMEDAVATNKVDIALTYIPIPHPDLDFLKVQEIEMGIYGHIKMKDGFEESKLPFVVPISPVEGSPNKVRGLDGWPDDAFPRNILYRVQMLETALGLCRKGLAFAYIPKFVARLNNDLVRPEFHLREFPLPQRFPKKKDHVYLVKRKSDREGAIAKKLAAVIRQQCSKI